MVVNSAGFVVLYDRGAPFNISGRARETISGGQFVFLSGAADNLSSGANSFDPKADFLFATGASGATFTGIAMHNAGSNEPLAVALDAVIISRAFGTVTAGLTVTCEGTDAIANGTTAGQVIGRALSSAGSNGFAAWRIGGE